MYVDMLCLLKSTTSSAVRVMDAHILYVYMYIHYPGQILSKKEMLG